MKLPSATVSYRGAELVFWELPVVSDQMTTSVPGLQKAAVTWWSGRGKREQQVLNYMCANPGAREGSGGWWIKGVVLPVWCAVTGLSPNQS